MSNATEIVLRLNTGKPGDPVDIQTLEQFIADLRRHGAIATTPIRAWVGALEVTL